MEKRNGVPTNVAVEVTRGSQTDVDNQELTVTFKCGGFTKTVEGHINNRTNFVHLSANDCRHEKELIHWNINLDDVGVAIENREIELN